MPSSANSIDENYNTRTTLATKIGGEDLVNDVMKVQQRFTPTLVAADTLIKTGSGIIGSIVLACNDSAPTAGNIDVYDNTTNSGTKIFSTAITTTYFAPITIPLNVTVSTGIYVKFTTTNDVNVTICWA